MGSGSRAEAPGSYANPVSAIKPDTKTDLYAKSPVNIWRRAHYSRDQQSFASFGI